MAEPSLEEIFRPIKQWKNYRILQDYIDKSRTESKLDLSGRGLTTLRELDLRNLHRVAEVNLSDNPLCPSALKDVPLKGLKKLDLSCCGFTLAPDYIDSFKQLEELNLSNNPLSGKLAPFRDLASLRSLKELDLSCCGLTQFPNGLNDCGRLEELNLSNNPLGCTSDLPLSEGWLALPRLKKLDLTGCGLTKFPAGLQRCGNLQELNLSKNFIGHSDLLDIDVISTHSKLIKVVFEDAVYTQNDGVWSVEWHEGVVSTSYSESSTKQPTSSPGKKIPPLESQTKGEGIRLNLNLVQMRMELGGPFSETYCEFFEIKELKRKLTIENYHSMLFSLKTAGCILNRIQNSMEQQTTCRRSLKIVHDELLKIELTVNDPFFKMPSLVLESITHLKDGALMLFKWLLGQTSLKESVQILNIKGAFKKAVEKTSEAFFDESCSVNRILLSKLRIISTILQSFSKPETAAHGCLQALQELHDLREIRESFCFRNKKVMLTYQHHGRRILLTVCGLNEILLKFVGKVFKPPPTVEEWPALISLNGETFNPLERKLFGFDTDIREEYTMKRKFSKTTVSPRKSKSKMFCVPVIKNCEHAVVDSIKIDKEGGCFCIPVASAFLVFPPDAVHGEVTLTCSRVKHKECEVKPRDGEAFVSRILKIEPECMVFRKPIMVLISHSVSEDQNFLDFYELVVINLNSDEHVELETERISSVEDIPKEIFKSKMLNDDLPFAKATIYETCTLVTVARFKSHQVLVPTNKTRIFSKKYGESKEVKITFPASVSKKILCLTVQLFPADAVFNSDVYLDDNLVSAPVIKVSGQTEAFLKPVDVELIYSRKDVTNIEHDFLPVREKIRFTTEYGLLLRSHKKTELESESLQTLNESQEVYIERPRKHQLKFSFSVEHFCKLCLTTRKCASAQLPKVNETCIVNPSLSLNLKYQAFVWAIYSSENSVLYAVLAPKVARRDLKAKWKKAGKLFGSRLEPEEKVYVCVPMKNDASHLPLDDCVLRFDDEDDYELPNKTSEDVHLDGEYMYFLVQKCVGRNHDLDEDGRVKVLIYTFEDNSNKENNEPVNQPAEDGRHGNDVSVSQNVTQNGHTTSQNETVRRNINRCEYFEEKFEEIFVAKLGINKNAMKNPDVGSVPKTLNDAGAMTGVILGLGVGVTIALSVGSFGIGSIVGATVAGVTFTVTKVDKKLKKCNAKKLDEKLEIYFHCHLQCIIIDVAKELSRMFEYQLFALKDEKQVEVLAECAVDLMFNLKKGDHFDRNTLLKKILQDGSMKKRELLTRSGNKWLAPDVFRKPGLRRMNVAIDRAEMKYFVKPGNTCDSSTYGYRGQFLEKKNYGIKSDEDGSVEVIRFRRNPTDNEAHTCEDPQLCEACSYYYENCTSGQYFVESSLDVEYNEPREEILTYQPVHILIQCPHVLNSFIGTLQTDQEPSLANFLKNKLELPSNHVVHPVYRQHSPGRGPDLKKSILTGSDFSHSDFTNSSLEECDFTKCVMLFAELAGEKLSGSKFVDTLISHCNLAKVKADHCEWTKTLVLYSRVDGACLDSVVPTVGGNCFRGTNICDATTAVSNETTVSTTD